MSAITIPTEIAAHTPGDTSPAGRLDALRALTRRRLSLSLRTPRAILLPLATPLLIALVIAPALAKVAGPVNGIDYMTYLAIGTAGLVIPLSAMQAGLGVIVDRNSGAQPDLLAAPIPRPFLVLANLLAALAASGLQLASPITFSIIRGATFHASVAGLAWFAAAAVALAVATYGIRRDHGQPDRPLLGLRAASRRARARSTERGCTEIPKCSATASANSAGRSAGWAERSCSRWSRTSSESLCAPRGPGLAGNRPARPSPAKVAAVL
jgi:hypothetical protein